MNLRAILVSDLHAGDGGALEDFALDEAFGEFLAFHADGKTRLILNGDTFDFLQAQPLGALTLQSVPGKVRTICAAHPGLLRALADFTRKGNRVEMLEGNHDVEFVFQEVQAAFREELVAAGGDGALLSFAQSTIDHIEGIHIEHGHQVDPLNCFDYERLVREVSTGLLQYPWGSHFVMRVFNAIEPKYRFIDKVRPEAGAALLLYLVDPELFKASVPGLLGLKVEGWLNGFRSAAAAKPTAGSRSKGVEPEAYAFAAEWQTIFNDLEVLEISGATSGASKGVLDGVTRRLILHLNDRWMGELSKNRSYDFVAAGEIAMRTGARVVIFGHTHHMGRVRVSDRAEYINSGSWTQLLTMPGANETSQWINEVKQRGFYHTINMPSYVHIDAEGHAELMIWQVKAARPQPAGY